MKINLEMTLPDAVLAMGEGNPGALRVLAESAERNGEIDPDNAFGPWGLLANLDNLGIYGEKIWILYKDLCGESVPKTTAIARACQLGIIPRKQLELAIDKKGPLEVDEIVGKVREELPNFRA